jgi:predicted unusual protein kinase regulating ubiquinone biosynthesis (AarF/ABC1/UbiB family)
MLLKFLKIPLLRAKYKYFPSEAQQFWQQELVDSQGLSAKLGQILSQGKVTKLPKASITNQAAEKMFRDQFHQKIEIADEALAASMGQVFFSSLDSKIVALKILHPNIKKTLLKEIDNIILLGKYYGKAKGFEFNSSLFKQFLKEIFEQETDLEREADFQEKFHRIFSQNEKIKIPHVIREFSNKDILTQEKCSCVLARDLKDINHFYIFDFFFESLFNHGVLHGDLNDRNWGIDDHGHTVVYDFGCSQIISPRRVNGFIKLLKNEDIVSGFKEFGVRLESTSFKDREQELRDALLGPLLDSEIKPDLAYSEKLKTEFGDEIKKLREYTDPWVLLLMRSLFALIRVYQDRGVHIPLQKILKPYLISKVDPMQATQIYIQVMEANSEVVSLRLPMTALENLSDLMPEKVSQKIHEQGLELDKICQEVISSGFRPQDLFKMSVNERSYRVWIA